MVRAADYQSRHILFTVKNKDQNLTVSFEFYFSYYFFMYVYLLRFRLKISTGPIIVTRDHFIQIVFAQIRELRLVFPKLQER